MATTITSIILIIICGSTLLYFYFKYYDEWYESLTDEEKETYAQIMRNTDNNKFL